MKVILVFSAIVALTSAVSYYTTGDDHLDIDRTMQDPANVKAYMECFLESAPCFPLAQSYKDILEDSLVTSCKRCNDDQKVLWHKFLWNLSTDYPDYYAAFQQKYDPNNLYISNLISVVSTC